MFIKALLVPDGKSPEIHLFKLVTLKRSACEVFKSTDPKAEELTSQEGKMLRKPRCSFHSFWQSRQVGWSCQHPQMMLLIAKSHQSPGLGASTPELVGTDILRWLARQAASICVHSETQLYYWCWTKYRTRSRQNWRLRKKRLTFQLNTCTTHFNGQFALVLKLRPNFSFGSSLSHLYN